MWLKVWGKILETDGCHKSTTSIKSAPENRSNDAWYWRIIELAALLTTLLRVEWREYKPQFIFLADVCCLCRFSTSCQHVPCLRGMSSKFVSLQSLWSAWVRRFLPLTLKRACGLAWTHHMAGSSLAFRAILHRRRIRWSYGVIELQLFSHAKGCWRLLYT